MPCSSSRILRYEPLLLTVDRTMPLKYSISCLLFPVLVVTANECSSVTWENTAAVRRAEPTPRTTTLKESLSMAGIGEPMGPGDVNYPYPRATSVEVSHGICAQFAGKYGIALEKFSMLNTELDSECGKIKPYTEYRVARCE